MTGYGKADYIFADHKTIIEIRSLNSKQLDLNLKTAPFFREKELDIRGLLQQRLERGKVDVSIYTQPLEATADQQFTPINWQAVEYYKQEYLNSGNVPTEMGKVPAEVMATILRFPDVLKVTAVAETLSDEEWALLQSKVSEALDAFVAFRTQEGASLEKMFHDKLDGIAGLLAEVEPYEKGRVDHIKEHLLDNLEKLSDKTKQAIDKNRLEQEMIYYLEKLDINEEKVRLTNHIKYFRETMAAADPKNIGQAGVGKKLGFVAQEMGREINTLGSKSNQSEMQIIVVKMKDLLEQIKEQVLNVL